LNGGLKVSAPPSEKTCMDDFLASLDPAGLRAALPAICGDEQPAAAAEFVRSSVVGELLRLAMQTAVVDPADTAKSRQAWGRWCGLILSAPTEAAWWINQAGLDYRGLLGAAHSAGAGR
jgi:hypothetical protein